MKERVCKHNFNFFCGDHKIEISLSFELCKNKRINRTPWLCNKVRYVTDTVVKMSNYFSFATENFTLVAGISSIVKGKSSE